MSVRINNLMTCLAGCAIASFLGLWLLLKFDNELLAILTAALVPTLVCYFFGTFHTRSLTKVAVYAGVGWILGYALQPITVQTVASRVARTIELPLVGYDWHVHASVVSTLLAMVGVFFASAPLSTDPGVDSNISEGVN